MIVKSLEILDRGTFIPAIAIKMVAGPGVTPTHEREHRR